MMTPYEKELVYTKRDSEGMITDVFDPKLNKYLRVVDTAITVNPSESSDEGEKTSKFAKYLQEAKNSI